MAIEPLYLRPVPAAEPFGAALRRLRIRAGLSQNQCARLSGVDPAYVNRLERAPATSTSLPSRKVVLALWAACDAGETDRERLLVAAGHCPEAIVQAGGWDAYIDGIRRPVDDLVNAIEAAARGRSS